MNIEEYTQLAIQDLRWELSEFQKHAKELARLKRVWGRYLYDEELNTAQAEQDLKQVYVARYKYYKYDAPLQIDTKLIDTFVKGDDIYCAEEKKLIEQKAKEKFIHQVIGSIEQESFSMNNILKHMLWEAGN